MFEKIITVLSWNKGDYTIERHSIKNGFEYYITIYNTDKLIYDYLNKETNADEKGIERNTRNAYFIYKKIFHCDGYNDHKENFYINCFNCPV